MKILVFEYIIGGGLAGQALPASLLAEGRMMLQALLDDLKLLPQLQVIVTLDDRCSGLSLPANAQVVRLAQTDDIRQILPELIRQSDAVWPIAPETDGVLAKIARQVIVRQKKLLLSDPDTVSLCADKLATYHRLLTKGIPVVETHLLADLTKHPFMDSVIKPIDGVGCQGNRIIQAAEKWPKIVGNYERYVIQPLVSGQAISLSCLFKQGKAWLLCCNQQQVVITRNRFNLQACRVNTPNDCQTFYQTVIDQVAEAMPGLWGYVGIDIIESDAQGPLILEINPRLTTSYVGIKQATGINLAEQVLNLLNGEPCLEHINHQSVNVIIH